MRHERAALLVRRGRAAHDGLFRDRLNNFLDTACRAVVHRLVLGDKREAMIKTVTFSAASERVVELLARFEAELRRDVATLEEDLAFEGGSGRRYAFALVFAPVTDGVE